MLYQCDHLDCIHKFWIEIKSLQTEVTCPKCERKSGVIIGFVVTDINKEKITEGFRNWIDDRLSEAIAWLEDKE